MFKGLNRQKALDPVEAKGYVYWEKINDKTGRVTGSGRGRFKHRFLDRVPFLSRLASFGLPKLLPLGTPNAIVDNARGNLADAVIGTAVTFPQYIGLGIGTGDVAGSDTALGTGIPYDDVDSTTTINEGAPYAAGDVTLTVANGAAIAALSVIRIENEYLYVSSKLGNDLTVIRGYAGTSDVQHADGLSIYTLTNEAKIANSRTLKGQYTSRIVAQFTTAEANFNIREIGLFEGNDYDTNLWARVNVTINKVNTERLNVYWYIVFERKAGLAIKSGASIATTGNIAAGATSTLTFASPVTVLLIENNSGEVMYVKLNEALAGAPPTNYDFRMADGTRVELTNEEVEVSTVHVYKAAAVAMPNNLVSVRGW